MPIRLAQVSWFLIVCIQTFSRETTAEGACKSQATGNVCVGAKTCGNRIEGISNPISRTKKRAAALRILDDTLPDHITLFALAVDPPRLWGSSGDGLRRPLKA